jgi:hypothetical protein
MTLEQFATLHKARIRRDSCGESIIPGRPAKAARYEDRNHIFAAGDQFGISLVCSTGRKFDMERQVKAVQQDVNRVKRIVRG